MKNFTLANFGEKQKKFKPAQLKWLEELIIWQEVNNKPHITLREIKEVLPAWQSVDVDMGLFVESALYNREQGKYTSQLPLISREELMELGGMVEEVSRKMLAGLELSKLTKVYSAIAGQELRAESRLTYVMSPLNYDELYQSFIIKEGRYLYCEANKINTGQGVANFFANYQGTPLQEKVYSLLGDINPSYFVETSGILLEMVDNQERIRRSRHNIIMGTLLEMDYLAEIGRTNTLAKPLLKVTSKNLAKEVDQVKNRLQTVCHDSFKTCQSDWQQELAKHLLISQVLADLGPIQELVILEEETIT